MYAKYIKQEYPDLNGTGRTQAYYKMELTHMDYRRFVSQCAREGRMEESAILGVLSLVSEKLPLCMAEGFSVKIDGIGTFNAKLGVRADMLQDAFEPGESSRNAGSIGVTGLSRTTATMELRRLAIDPASGIRSRGERSQKVYVLREQ